MANSNEGAQAGQVEYTQVRDLKCGLVMSMPDTQLRPSLITSISSAMGSVRFIGVEDIETNEPHARLVLDLNRGVVLHDVLVEQHIYQNESSDVIAVTFGGETINVAPGESVEYLGQAKPTLFPEGSWNHAAHDVVID